jgi:hypothetical protein
MYGCGVALLSLTASCGTAMTKSSAGTGGGGSSSCHLDPPGTPFTITVHNGGTKMLGLAEGCGLSYPIVLDTPEGMLGIGPGPADPCEFSCDRVYAGMAGVGCSDCGNGSHAPLPPGASVTITWDRRVYAGMKVPSACVNGPSSATCAFGHAVAPTSTQQGVLTACADPNAGGQCLTASQMPVTFTLDTTKSSGTIEVM